MSSTTHADFRLMTRRTLDALQDYREVNLFLRGIVPLIGFSSVKVYYTRASRAAGESKYPLRRMLSLAWEGITSFSIIPLRIVTALGAVIFALTLLMSFYVLIIRLFSERACLVGLLPYCRSTFLGGVQILAIGILGEYLGKVYREVKARPRYAIEKRINV